MTNGRSPDAALPAQAPAPDPVRAAKKTPRAQRTRAEEQAPFSTTPPRTSENASIAFSGPAASHRLRQPICAFWTPDQFSVRQGVVGPANPGHNSMRYADNPQRSERRRKGASIDQHQGRLTIFPGRCSRLAFSTRKHLAHQVSVLFLNKWGFFKEAIHADNTKRTQSLVRITLMNCSWLSRSSRS